jgi:hypothetical protein
MQWNKSNKPHVNYSTEYYKVLLKVTKEYIQREMHCVSELEDSVT